MSNRVALALAILAGALLSVPAQAGRLGQLCKSGDMSACKRLCGMGYSRACAKARGGGRHRRMMVELGERTLRQAQADGLVATGLTAVFPKSVICPPVSSPFASRTRYDGSLRAKRADFGRHGGMDMSLRIGTPIHAIYNGTVINKRHGNRLIGIEMVVRQSPADTGLKVWTFTTYKHFSRMPKVKVGEKVKRGEVIGLSGNSGTVGGHFGRRGYPHLHVSAFMNANGAYSIRHGRAIIRHGHYVDPLAFYFRRSLDSNAIRKLPASERKVAIPYVTANGTIVPAGSPAVWPVACQSKVAHR
ncbi:MAG: M23 family metallopeptidase [Pseudolabrys sp.]